MAPSMNVVVVSVCVGTAACLAWYYLRSNRFQLGAKVLTPALTAAAFRPFVVQSNELVSHNTHRIRFELPEGTTTLGLAPVASYLLARFVPAGQADAKPVVRPYTPVTTEEESQKGKYFDLVIKQYPNGPMSTHICSLKPGDTIEVKGPNPKLNIDKDQHTHIGMIAGGTGITPMLQVIRHIFHSSSAPLHKNKRVSLVFANVEEKDILLRTELDQLAKTYPDRFKVHYVLDKPPSKWDGSSGRVNSEIIKANLPSASEGEKALIMVCGPAGMVAHVCGPKNPDFTQGALGGLLKELKYQENQVFKF